MARAWVDGRLCDALAPEPAPPGVFETVRCAAGALFFVDEHLARLEHGARTLGLPWPPPFEPRAALASLACQLDLAAAALRLAWTPPRLSVLAREVPPLAAGLSAELTAAGEVELPAPFGVKTTRRADYDRRRAEAQRRGAFEVLVRARDGALVEGTATNLFLALEGELVTPPLASGALPGVVRARILTELEREPLRDALGRVWRARERSLELVELLAAEEVLLTNSVRRVAALARWTGADGARDDLPGAGGPVARALHARVEHLESATRWDGCPASPAG